MNHPEHILRTLDSHLREPARLILYGRAALALGYPDSPPEFHSTMDVDAILPEIEMSMIETDDSFWNAIEKTNQDLDSAGLYLTHLFTDSQVILRPDWLEHLRIIEMSDLRYLQIFRPATPDLILTKMMRIDPQDRSDIRFLLGRQSIDKETLRQLLAVARVPQIPEISEAFSENSRWLEKEIGEF